MLFSQRNGFETKVLQKNDMDNNLRVSIWNIIFEYEMKKVNFINDNSLFEKIWVDIFKKPLDNFLCDDGYRRYSSFRHYFMNEEWYKIYDIIEYLLKNSKNQDLLKPNFNEVLIRENSAYRIVGFQLVLIVDDVEIDEIEEVLTCKFNVVKNQIQGASKLLSDRKNPDYKNSFKESISAVESLCKIILNNDSITLGQALNEIEKMPNFKINGALKQSFSSLYGYASNEVRHGKIEDSEVDYDLAKFMVVSCSAFINYLISKMD